MTDSQPTLTEIENLFNYGYVVIPECLPVRFCDAIRERVIRMKRSHSDLILKNSDEHGYLNRVVNLHLALDELADAFSYNEKALKVCDEFFREPSSLYTSLYFERGSEQSLHRDSPYFTTRPAGRYLGVWLALDDVDERNGPLQVVPGSHKLPLIDICKLRQEVFGIGKIPPISAEGWDRYQAEVKRSCDERGMSAVSIHVKRGDVIIWHPELFHGGAPHIVRQLSRRSLVMHVTPVDMPVYQLDVFYDSEKIVGTKAPWEYISHGGRKIAKFDQIDFGHEYTVKPKDLW